MEEPVFLLKNRLGTEKGLYLNQHATNPVAWQCWDELTFSLASKLKRPLFISIGYAACHWCHVMERESFTDTAVAEFLNTKFIPVKIDREERPEIDALYIQAAQLMGVSAGWPLSIFADEEGHPFHIGTYYPPKSHQGRPAFLDVLRGIREYWDKNRETIQTHTDKLRTALEQTLSPVPLGETPESIDTEFFGEDKEFADLNKQYFDSDFGGFKFHSLNKFPPSMALQLLMRIGVREEDNALIAMSEKTLEGMYSGGLYDHLRGGIARYSTDYAWRVPHFEKMLYDNALFIEALNDAYLLTKKNYYLKWAMETADYLLAELVAPTGGFMSAQDADSEGVEGKYFLWSYRELATILTQSEFEIFTQIFNISEAGNFEGANILYFKEPYAKLQETLLKDLASWETFDKIKQKLLKVRYQRVAPLTDQKILVSWNGLAIAALARLGRLVKALGHESGNRYLEGAERAFLFIDQTLFDRDKDILYRRYIEGEIRYHGLLTDYANLSAAGLELYESTFKSAYRETAHKLLSLILKFFKDDQGFFYEQDGRIKPFITRYSDAYDNTEPSGNSKLAEVLLKFRTYGMGVDYTRLAEQIFTTYRSRLGQGALPYMLRVLHDYRLGLRTLTFQGGTVAERKSFLKAILSHYEPGLLLNFHPTSKNNPLSVILCKGTHCLAPIRDVKTLVALLAKKNSAFEPEAK